MTNDLTQMVNFPTRIPDCDSHSPGLLDFFLSLTQVFILQWLSLHWELLIMLLFQVPLTFAMKTLPSYSQWDAWLLQCIAYDYSCADWDGLHDHLRDIPWEDIYKLGASAVASIFCECIQVGIDVYIPHRKYQGKPHSSPWFSAVCAAAIVHGNHFFSFVPKG